MARIPELPLLPVPDRITPSAYSLRSSASETKNVSIGRRAARLSLDSARCSTPSAIVTSRFGRIM
jgi:hypothetical protein